MSNDLEVTGLVKAGRFEGDGSGLTNILNHWKSSSDGTGIYFDQGNVGIGTTTPIAKLDVSGNIYLSVGGAVIKATAPNSSLAIASGIDSYMIFNTNDEERMRIDISGNIGIGTTAPRTRLDLGTGSLTFSADTGGKIMRDGTHQILGITTDPLIDIGSSALWQGIRFFPGAGEAMRITSAGNVGIGTTSPSVRLQIGDGVSNTYGGYTVLGIENTDHAEIELVAPSNKTSQYAFSDENGKAGMIAYSHVTDSMSLATSGSEKMVITNSGNVGIGTTSPLHKLHVQGNIMAAAANGVPGRFIVQNPNGANPFVYGDNAGGGQNIQFRNSEDTATRMYMDMVNGNVGVGTTAPTAKLQVDTGGGSVDSDALFINNSPSPNYSTLKLLSNWTDGGAAGNLITAGNNSGTKLVLTNNGNVGIGTASPTQALDVVGNINVSGNINAKYQDVAEWVASSQELRPGTVVVIDEENNNQVVASMQPNDTKVAGVVSYKPGLILGDGGEGQYMIAHTGRVKVKVDASFGAIHKGDLLTTSSKQGVAMKSEAIEIKGRAFHQPGTILGKALESLEKGEGEILVLLSLQ